ncbi:hypothetical protein LUZ62_047813 [Rhynchospora pubera]|uniref:DUF4220 domain-containing protein n=1 Tax=Rhynchospora pubera TaxID=906938 RepID=A0AAV8FTI6_9POAL|nr:hypothetical protein LUZ62_047813 [Rhynchospora pubera]
MNTLEMNNVLEKAKILWNKEQIKVLIMLSLTLQIILLFCAPLRKRIRDKRLLILLWLAYLGADYVATLTLGSILANRFHNAGADLPGQSLTAFWAPFLLIHLGGPYDITSYSIEDNELWLRHLLSFVVQVSTALLVLVQSTLQTSRLLVPSMLIFIVGMIKFGERTLALRAASMQRIKHLTDLYSSNLILTHEIDSSHGEEKLILQGYVSFCILRPHIVNTYFIEPKVRHDFVIDHVNRDFKLIGVELSILYDILHTKAIFIHQMRFLVIRIASLISILIALVIFHISEKQWHDISDLMVTYILLSVALFLEIYSALSLVASKWMIISLRSQVKMGYKNISNFICRAKNHMFCRRSKERWSGCIGQYSLIQSVIMSKGQGSNWFKKTWDFLFRGEESAEVSDILEKTVINHIKNFIEPGMSPEGFPELLRKMRSSWITNTLDRYQLHEIKNVMKGKGFGECVIAWHMATDMCYFASNNAPGDNEEGHRREAIYSVSNYMMYLILERSSMMPPGFAELTTVRTVQTLEGSDIFSTGHPDSRQARVSLYEAIVGNVTPEYWPRCADTALPLVLNLLRRLKQIVEKTSEQRQWEVIRDVWMEMLTYAAVHCSRTEHFRSLSRGGELLTHYWLLLAHYGIMEENNANIGRRFIRF